MVLSFAAGAFLLLIVFAQDRSQLLVIISIILLIYVRHLNASKKIIYGIYSVFGILILMALIVIARPDIFEHYFTMYENIYDLFSSGSSSESSSGIRIVESQIAIKGFADHPWFGNGFVSSQWRGGFSGKFGYFYPSDVGILGNLFVYGIIGTLIFYIPIIFSLIWAVKLRKLNNIFFLTCVYTMLFTFLDMFTAASNIKYIGIMMFYFGMMYYFRYLYKPDETIQRA